MDRSSSSNSRKKGPTKKHVGKKSKIVLKSNSNADSSLDSRGDSDVSDIHPRSMFNDVTGTCAFVRNYMTFSLPLTVIFSRWLSMLPFFFRWAWREGSLTRPRSGSRNKSGIKRVGWQVIKGRITRSFQFRWEGWLRRWAYRMFFSPPIPSLKLESQPCSIHRH